ncbi:hypothetical protein P4E94_03435 [Pontiellaceae bacterium B12219]|nr:hypothetical protein [Pontiellaceae bacterium B12219]
MKWFVKFFFAVLVLLGVSGCVSPAPMKIAGLEFVNATDFPVTHVELQVLSTYEVASCNYIAPDGKFKTTFPLLEYRGHEIQVFWRNRLGKHTFGPTVVPQPKDTSGKSMMVVITLAPGGRASVSFREKNDLGFSESE